MKIIPSLLQLCFISLVLISCKKGIQQQNDQLYSRHLQRQVKLTIFNTPVPDDKTTINLLLLNDGQEADNIRLATTMDSLYKKDQIEPLVVVAVHAGNRKEEFGVAGAAGTNNAGAKADHYDSFFNNELYPFAKKKAGVRKFKSVTIAGFGASALSALDIAWTHSDKISRVGLFSPAFNRKENKELAAEDSLCTGMMHEKIQSSRKRPNLQFWIYAGKNGKTGLPNDDADNIFNCSGAFVELLSAKKFISDGDIVYTRGLTNNAAAWQEQLPEFLKWAFGR
ncbi:MAG: alpha/beta hydrolase [Agriterribacter sp.]